MGQYLSVGQAAREVGVSATTVSQGFARGWLSTARCPLVNRWRLVPRDYLDEMRAVLVSRGYLSGDEAAEVPSGVAGVAMAS
jgi:hypothetical protein